MEFEFDERKSRRNREKHGIDFIEAQSLWEDPDRLEIPAKTEDEPRTLLIGTIGEKRWTAVFTMRGQRVRIISARRAGKKEVELYEG